MTIQELAELAKSVINLSLEDMTKFMFIMENRYNVKINIELSSKNSGTYYVIVESYKGSKVNAAKVLRSIENIPLKETIKILDEAPKFFVKFNDELDAERVVSILKNNNILARIMSDEELAEGYF